MSSTSFFLTLRNLWNMARIGSATFLTEIAMSITILIGNYQFMALLHEEGVAAYAVVCYLFPVIFSVNNAVAQAAQPIISYNYGAGNSERVKKTFKLLLGVCLTYSFLLWGLIELFPQGFAKMFCSDAALIDFTANALRATTQTHETHCEITVASAAPLTPILSPKINIGSSTIFDTAPIITVTMPIFAKPCAVINAFMPRVSWTNTVPKAYIFM